MPGTDGYFTVMGEHAPLMTTLKPGFITVTDLSNVAHVFYVRGGFADVAPAGLTILAEEARPVADFNRNEIEALIASGMTPLQAAITAAGAGPAADRARPVAQSFDRRRQRARNHALSFPILI